MKWKYKTVMFLTLLIFCVGSVCATDNNTDSLITVGDNSLELDNTSNSVVNLTNSYNNSIANNTTDLFTVPCAVSVYISVMESYNKTVDVETGIKETHTVNNVTSVDRLVNAFTNQGLNCNVIKTKSIKDLKELHKDNRNNIIVHMFIDNRYHFAHIKEIKHTGILFNNRLFIKYDVLNQYYTNVSIIVTNATYLNLNFWCNCINKSEWVNITGELSEKALFKYNIGLIDTSIISYSKYTKLKANIKDDDTKRSFDSLEYILFGDTLKPKMANVLTIKKKLKPVIADSNVPDNLLRNFNNALTPMQKNLNETIRHLNFLSGEIVKFTKSSNVDVPKLLGGCNLFINNLKVSINNLNPLNAHPELREKLDQKYGLEHHKFGFIDYYTLKK